MRQFGTQVYHSAKNYAQKQANYAQVLIKGNNQNESTDDNTQRPKVENIQRNKSKKRLKRRLKYGHKRIHVRPIVPPHYICPITQELMIDPVFVSSGHTFERSAIVEWFDNGNMLNPLTGQTLESTEIKPNYALKDAIADYRRKLADELFRIAHDENLDKEILHYKNGILFDSNTKKPLQQNSNHDDDEDGYLSDDDEDDTEDEEEEKKRHIPDRNANTHANNSINFGVYRHASPNCTNIPILAFLGPNGTGKSTLLNLIAGEPVFVTMNELTDFDCLSKVVRFKIVSRADGEFILLDVEGLFPDGVINNINDSVMKIFLAVYAISSVIVWNDTDENNPLLHELLQRANTLLEDINTPLHPPYPMMDDISFANDTPGGGLLPEELRQFLLKKYRKLNRKQNIGCEITHKPAFIFLRRDFKRKWNKNNIIVNADCSSTCSSTVQSSDGDINHRSSPSCMPSISLHSSSASPRLRRYQILHTQPKIVSSTSGTDGNSVMSSSLKIVDEIKEIYHQKRMFEKPIIFGHQPSSVINHHHRRMHSVLFSNYLQQHSDFQWLRDLNLFSFVDGVILQKLDSQNSSCNNSDDDDGGNAGGDDNYSMLAIIPKLERWIEDWCKVANNDDMLAMIRIINKHDTLSSFKYVDECLNLKGSRLQKYFMYDVSVVNVEKLIEMADKRFEWNTKNLIRWFKKHFNRLWYHMRHFPNAHQSLLYQTLFYEFYLDQQRNEMKSDVAVVPILPTIVVNFSHFYFQLCHKIDLYENIMENGYNWGQFAGATTAGITSLSLISFIHPLLGIVAVPFGIKIGQKFGQKSGEFAANVIANHKAFYLDHNQRYELGKFDMDCKKNVEQNVIESNVNNVNGNDGNDVDVENVVDDEMGKGDEQN